MAAPTIIIGIGTSGLITLENAQRFYYETYKVNKPKNVEFLYIETNSENHPAGTPLGNDITRVFISLDDMAEMIEELKRSSNDPKWMPDSKTVLSAGLGAGGIRSCGRLALWGSNKKGDNFTQVIIAIQNAHKKVKNVNSGSATDPSDQSQSEKTSVFITGSLTGGTGSGVFIDVGYLIRHIIEGILDVYGLFLLPKQPVTLKGYEVMYGNAYGAIKDLDFYNKFDNVYAETWPNGFVKNYQEPPFVFSQFLSQDYQDGTPAIGSLDGLYKMAGLYLFLNIAGIYKKRRERLVDASGNSLIGSYGTFGLSAIQFPKDQIEEYIASELSMDLLGMMTNSAKYMRSGQKNQISRATIKQNMSVEFDKILANGFGALNSVEGKDLVVSIEKNAIKINKGQIQGSPTEYIIGMFTSSKNDNYYAMVSNNIKAAINVFIDGIYTQVDLSLQSTENFYFAKYVLEDLVECIEKTLNYWQSMGLSSQTQKWDNELRKLAVNATENTYKIVLEQDNVLKDRLKNILELMKVHLTVKVLKDISLHIKEGKIKLEGTNHELPKLSTFDEIIRKINVLIGNGDDLVLNVRSFKRRMGEIKADVEDQTLPILRVYPSNSFDMECENAKLNYYQKHSGRGHSIQDVIQHRNILVYFKNKLNTGFYKDVYLEFLNEYRSKIESSHCIEDFDIASFVSNNVQVSIATAKRSTSPFLKINKILPPIPSIPRFVIGDSLGEVTSVINSFNNQNYTDFQDSTDGKMELIKLKNIVVFYDEKGNFTLTKDLSYIDLMKNCYETVPPNLADENVTVQRWTANRSAYSTKS
ncbi:hypothetical protein IM793_22900 [Pedobacter sp. MR2016-19]|uniref:tubulin-like doman-containing protein n=1 Tax=Pedobacter sp. MR2016-19 TaxID=2780089 RepID=UPI001876D3C3|nr:tubulin-like doman-containing protein [Pedobacter sp. MR2016-19]MBE5322022.1 hypothetical protein [Pedobacter sp. MR2016-19]